MADAADLDAAGEAGESAAEGEGGEHDAGDGDSGEAGGDGVFADDAEAEAEGGFAKNKCDKGGDEEGDEEAGVESGVAEGVKARGVKQLAAGGEQSRIVKRAGDAPAE